MVGSVCRFQVSGQPGMRPCCTCNQFASNIFRFFLEFWVSALACLYQMERCKMRVAANAMSAVIIAVIMLLGGAMAAEVAQSPSPTAQTGAAAAAFFAPCMAAAIVASLIAFLFF
eukprot:Gb_28210 [translate_table: standard]